MRSRFGITRAFALAVLVAAYALGAYAETRPVLDAPLGVKVEVVRENPHLSGCVMGATGTVSEVRRELWMLIDARGNQIGIERDLPDGFIPWDWETEDFPLKPVGVLLGNVVYHMDDGSVISIDLTCGLRWEDTETTRAFVTAVQEKNRIIDEKVRAAQEEDGGPSDKLFL